MIKRPTALIILDGFGYSPRPDNPIEQASTPTLNSFLAHYPHTYLEAAGEHVGLLPGMIGNSEVGHTTMGAGSSIEQPVALLHRTIADKSFFSNAVLQANLISLKKQHGNLHIMGLLTDAGVHTDLTILFAFIKAALDASIDHIYLHLFLDGRDEPPQSASALLQQVQTYIANTACTIASIQGRFYAMDRDQNWDRTVQSYAMLTAKQSTTFQSGQEILDHYYAQGITDEYIPPTQLDPNGFIHGQDGVIFINTRPDRARQLTQAFIDPHFNKFLREPLPLLFFITPVVYDPSLQTTHLFNNKDAASTFMDDLAQAGLQVVAIAETEKYAHITYFFNGGRERPFPNETYLLIPSLKVKSYVKFPCMSAAAITATVVKSLTDNPKDFYLINYANADMVGHSGDFAATKQAIECLDEQLGILYKEVVELRNGTMYITADHGNAEEVNQQGTHTYHTSNKVPFIWVAQQVYDNQQKLPLHELADIRTFIAQHMGLKKI